ncbi:muconate/chloromuconate family cycloisomerase [Mycolicibacterium sp. YH-1]|uniref:muconate/chloromuconate family cycloisomerase n=1 Tax=Mycolicibacterium sp. YH-1 TaxID=2908837 RepID=UPI001F4C2286|nr:muconate/chloromuconate family cycloisomerase [Mycolicibacterium sp. YH-1]UNB54553.1 muconate/chloromuconate family cycloisomerase [Mycolicibacterium sp. YH-1]
MSTVQRIVRVETSLLDIPLKRPHRFSVLTIDTQAVLLVRILTSDGIVGIGEGVVPGGPWWGGESVEGMRALIDGYVGPLLIDEDALRVDYLAQRMNRLIAGASFAKSAVEMALWDICGKALGAPLWQVWGGYHRAELPVTWALGAESADLVVEEANTMLASGRHTSFKLKMGASAPADDVARVAAIAEELRERAHLSVDLNGSWDEATARRWLPALDDAGIGVVEQPLPAWDLAGAARLRHRHRLQIMADEAVLTPVDAVRVSAAHAADVFSVKIAKCGGISGLRRVAAVAEANGIACFGGTTIETSIGTAAAAHAYCSNSAVSAGTELFGPLLLADDIVEKPVEYTDGHLLLGDGPGLGVSIDEGKVEKYLRK